MTLLSHGESLVQAWPLITSSKLVLSIALKLPKLVTKKNSLTFKIRPEQALAALEANLEIKILEAYMSRIEWRLNEPIRVYS